MKFEVCHSKIVVLRLCLNPFLCPKYVATRENKRRIFSVVGQKTITIINTGAAFMGARDWDEETSINL